MSIGSKVFTSFWERVFQIVFPGGFLTIKFGLWYMLGALIISSLSLLLQRKIYNSKKILSTVILNVCIMAVFMFVPILLGVYIGILVCNSFYSMKTHRNLPLRNKILLGILNGIGILGMVASSGIIIFFWRFLVSFVILGGFIGGILSYLVKPVRNFFFSFPLEITSQIIKTACITTSIMFIVLGGLFTSTGFIRPYIPAAKVYSPSGAMNITLVTYNIRLGTGIEEDKYDFWKYRKDNLVEYIDSFNADFLCIQEAYHFQIRYLIRTLDTRTYKYVGAGRDDGVISGEHACILFDSVKYRVITGGNFWLSDYPFYPSQTWHGTHNKDRVVTWVRFAEIASNEEIVVVSVHYDSGAEFRQKANILLNERIVQYSGNVPVIIGGDFNYNSSMSGWELMENYGTKPLQSAYHIIHGIGPHLIDTTNSFDLTYDSPTNMIDFFFVSADVTVTSCEVLQDTYIGPDTLEHFPSDHFPVIMQCLV